MPTFMFHLGRRVYSLPGLDRGLLLLQEVDLRLRDAREIEEHVVELLLDLAQRLLLHGGARRLVLDLLLLLLELLLAGEELRLARVELVSALLPVGVLGGPLRGLSGQLLVLLLLLLRRLLALLGRAELLELLLEPLALRLVLLALAVRGGRAAEARERDRRLLLRRRHVRGR